jgi:DNA (cytosine-5)-methyltransferase 1
MFNFNFIDLFCGIGGMRIPFDELGGKCVFSSEMNKFSIQTYEANFYDKPSGDITKIHPESIPQHDLLLAGFPCQPFSQAGKKQGFEDHRGQMFFYIAQILNYHRPQAVLLENVKGFRNHDKGRTLKMVLYILSQLGYSVSYNVLSAKDFNLPQNRERIYIVAFQKKNKHFRFPTPIGLNKKVGDILENNVDEKYTISDKMWEGHQKRKEKHKEKGNGFGYSLVNSDTLYTNTISARYWKDGSEILLEQKGKNPRVLTPRECSRLQGFPESFKIVVSDRQAWQQFGNSVAVPVIRAIATEIVSYMSINDRLLDYTIIDLESLIFDKMKILYPEDFEKQLCISGV